MKISNKNLNPQIKKQVYRIFYQSVAAVKDEEEARELLEALMSRVEILAIAKRLAIAVFLDKGHSYDHIKRTLRVSSATIAGVAENLQSPGIQKAIERIRADEWAEKWSRKIVGWWKRVGG